MQLSNIFVILFLVGTGVHFVLNQILEFVDYRARLLHGTEIPPELTGYLDGEKLSQTVQYENAKYFLWNSADCFKCIAYTGACFPLAYYTFMVQLVVERNRNVICNSTFVFSLFGHAFFFTAWNSFWSCMKKLFG